MTVEDYQHFYSPEIRSVCDEVIGAARALRISRTQVLALVTQHFGEKLENVEGREK